MRSYTVNFGRLTDLAVVRHGVYRIVPLGGLTEVGQDQATRNSKMLKGILAGKRKLIVSSDLQRAEETARIIAYHTNARLSFTPLLRDEFPEAGFVSTEAQAEEALVYALDEAKTFGRPYDALIIVSHMNVTAAIAELVQREMIKLGYGPQIIKKDFGLGCGDFFRFDLPAKINELARMVR